MLVANVKLLKKLFTVGLISISPTMVFANCSDEERVEMLKAGVSAEYIKSFCEMDVEFEPPRDQQGNPVTTEQEKPETFMKEEEKLKEGTASENDDAERISELEEKLETIENQENPAYWREKQPYGLGGGFGFGLGMGALIYFDYNIDSRNQLHFQYDSLGKESSSLMGSSTINISQTLIAIIVRRSFSPNYGWYYGAGIGLVTTQLDYDSPLESVSTSYNSSNLQLVGGKYSAEAQGVGYLLDIGWQGYDGYYFTISLQPMATTYTDDNFDANKIADYSNHRSYSEDEWEKAKSSGRIFFGFGGYFGD